MKAHNCIKHYNIKISCIEQLCIYLKKILETNRVKKQRLKKVIHMELPHSLYGNYIKIIVQKCLNENSKALNLNHKKVY